MGATRQRSIAMNRFEGQVAIVTGGASGIGEAICRRLAREGAKVVIADYDGAAAQALAAGLGEADALAFQLDVADAAAVERMVQATVERFGGLHLAVNNAGIGGPIRPAPEYPPADWARGIDANPPRAVCSLKHQLPALPDWHRVIDVNLHGVMYSMKHELPAMLASGGGSIVNMASILGSVGWSGSIAYVAAKHALLGMTKTAAMEYAPQGIRVNAVGP